MKDFVKQILELLEARPGLKAKEIAQQLEIEKQLVNSALHGQLRGRVHQDKRYRWFSTWQTEDDLQRREESKKPNTPLARLCRYYLECLNHDDLGGVSEFAASKYGNLAYVELPFLPHFAEEGRNPFELEDARKLLMKVRRDRNRQTLFLGYPTRLNHIRSRRGWEGFLIEPILLYQFRDDSERSSKPELADELPQINFKALRSLSSAGEMNLMEEAILLAEELGLGNAIGELPELDDLLKRLFEIRREWDWREEPHLQKLSSGPCLADLDTEGIYNRAVLVASERSPYTKGLETELGQLQSSDDDELRKTALGSWLDQSSIDSPPAKQQPLLEILPLNSEQRQGVLQGLENPLTVITGPPGTGKSQVVTSILVNAAWQGKRVLFASKNNKAVDVVEARVNDLGPRPVLLRMGVNQYQAKLSAYLGSLLASRATQQDEDRHKECIAAHRRLQEQFNILDGKFRETVDLRNAVDALEQDVEGIRECLGQDLFQQMKAIDREALSTAAILVLRRIHQADIGAQGLLVRLLWPRLRASRYANMATAMDGFRQVTDLIGVQPPGPTVEGSDTEEWTGYARRLKERLIEIGRVQSYFDALSGLLQREPLEELSRERVDLIASRADNSAKLWDTWLRLQPSRMSLEQRKLLGNYSALLQMIVSANDRKRRPGGKVIQEFHSLFPKVSEILGCWAITSLSARGRLPLEPGFFDLLVIDEASQCDIASALPLLFRSHRVVVIGDPMQLRHISSLPKQQDQQFLCKYDLVEDLAGWAYSSRSLFDLASSLCRSEDIIALRDHHRSHADIIGFSNDEFYEGRLRVATRYDRLRMPSGDGPAVRWVNVQGEVRRPSAGGARNDVESQAVVSEIERLVSQGYSGSIGVVSPFRAQANRIRDMVHKSDSLASWTPGAGFLADTVHKFQGDERDVMIFSPVVSRGIRDTALGFLRRNANLFNVAITRARAALVVVGDQGAAETCNVEYLRKFASYVKELQQVRGGRFDVLKDDYGPEYPSVDRPEWVSDWERELYRTLFADGIKTIPQFPVEKYLLDFALINGDRRLNIEVDGERYHRAWDGELCRRDQIRNQRLMELGWDVMRFWVYQIRDELPECRGRVRAWMMRGDA